MALGTLSRGIALAAQGQHAAGIAQMRQGLAAVQATGTTIGRPDYLAQLAKAYGQGGQDEESVSLLAEALAIVGTTGARAYESELYRLRGELLLQQTMPEVEQAEVCFQHAFDVAHRQQAKSLELRGAMSLACLWQQQGKRQEAYDLLAPVYGWFTEGFDTADLTDAKALLDELLESRG